jgi:Heparinase II/III-like protein
VHPLESDLLPAQGFGILRRNGGGLFVGLDYGHSGGGHGHPDRLNLLLSDGDARWFDDPGTGSYVDESLHWYRSTLAHTAPLLDGRSQPRVHGTLLAFEEQGVAGWMSAQAPLADDCVVRRSVVALHDYLVDRIEWTSDRAHDVSLPLHGVVVVSATGAPIQGHPSPIEGGVEREDGFRYLADTGRLPVDDDVIRLRGARGGTDAHRLDGWIASAPRATWWSARTLGAPGRPEQSLVLPRVNARAGTITGVWSWPGAVAAVIADGDALRITRSDGSVDVHAPRPDGWEIFTGIGSSIVLRGQRHDADVPAQRPSALPTGRGATPLPLPAHLELGEEQYRRSEESWTEAGSPTASVSIERGRETLNVSVVVPMSARRFLAIDAENPYDNDPAAIHGDGVQLYVEAADRSGGWLLVPDGATNDVGMRVAEGWSDEIRPRARWRPTGDGYQLDAELPIPRDAAPLALDVLVNVSGPDRQRRRGQLVLSGGRGEFVYLRSDRHDRERLLLLTPSSSAASS